MNPPDPRLEAFIARWQGQTGGQERANYATFLNELVATLDLPPPDPASANPDENDYVFERLVREPNADGTFSPRRIDLYKRGCFVLEAKQSRQPGGKKEVAGQPALFPLPQAARIGTRTANRAWDVLMFNARQQAEAYARALPVDHGWPPFIIVCDVGHVLEVYADFSGQGKNYAQFPDRQRFRIYLEDLRDTDVRTRLAAIWTDPQSLDPARITARVTRQIAERLAAVSKALEAQHHAAEDVAMFLMRCLFTMFAEDVGLLPAKSFRDLLVRCEQNPEGFQHLVRQLWEAMNTGGFAMALATQVKRFNGEFFRSTTVLPLGREEIGELRQAASHDWRQVDPSIFGTLLEQALDPTDRRRLGAHYTPRAYVERLVVATVIEPLRDDWRQVLSTAERQKQEGRLPDAIATLRDFHQTLCATRVLDPACGTGNFLYVALELMKRLEGEVLEALADLGGQEALTGLGGHSVDPHQFLGLEINPRAAAISELVLWIGHLQWQIRTIRGDVREPILQAFHNIHCQDAVLQADQRLARAPDGKPLLRRQADGAETEVYEYRKPRRPAWPVAEFIVGNPPFIGGKDIRERMGDGWTEALWRAHPQMNDSADFVMYWWDHAAELLTAKGTKLRRFGLVTTNSITQVFQRRVVERHLQAKAPISLLLAIPDHPWTKASRDAAAVRIAMTVCVAGTQDGVLRRVTAEAALDSDTPRIAFAEQRGRINPDLTLGVDVTAANPLRANDAICSPGVKLHGDGFIVTPAAAAHLGMGRRAGLDRHIRQYRNGRDLTSRPRGVMVIDLFGMTEDDVRRRFPEVWQHVRLEVKEKTITKDGETVFVGRDWNHRKSYKDNWWIFGEPRSELRPALAGLPRYIATVETMKHRIFQFLDAAILPDNMLIAIGSADAFHLGVLSSRIHVTWAVRAGGWLGMGNDPRYSKSRTFDPFPFPLADKATREKIRAIAEDLDVHRKRVLAEHPQLTLTGLYNVLEILRGAEGGGEGLDPGFRRGDGERVGDGGRGRRLADAIAGLSAANRQIFDDGLVLILKELHDRLDSAVAAAYGWPVDLAEGEILQRLVTLNRERAAAEAVGHVQWLRPDYQIARLGTPAEKKQLDLVGGALGTGVAPPGPKPSFPTADMAQTAAVMLALADTTAPLGADALAARFRQGRRVAPKVALVLSALTRMGFVGTSDAGRSFSLRGTPR